VKQIARKATDPRDNRPYDPVKISNIEITGLPKAATPAKKPTTARKRTTAKPTTSKPK
jgi:hypothetical protein